MHGIRRVITFCCLTTVLPTILIVIPLYLRHVRYADVMYKVSDSDVIQIHQGQSSIFCDSHSLKMNSTFHAFQMKGIPKVSHQKKNVQLKKSMSLPDDTLEYWGFYLLAGATVELKACSRYEGSKILVVKGDRILQTCGILNNHRSKVDPSIDENEGHVVVTVETPVDVKKLHQSTQPYKVIYEKKIEFDNDAAEDSSNDSVEKESKNILEHLQRNLDNIKLSINDETENVHHNLVNLNNNKIKRQVPHIPHHLLDKGVNHGGNAFNNSLYSIQDSSVSSFENNMYQCFKGNILMTEVFPSGEQCKNVQYLEKTTILKVTHDIQQDGYYYYIFYSDNDFVVNDIHAIFDIYKPTFQYANLSESKMCVNKTECHFNVAFFGDELVIVEIPTKDGIEHKKDDFTILISTCHPRMSIYIFFPVSVLILILLCAFL